MNNEQFDISKLMNEISPQFDKVVKELRNTLDVIGKVIKENLNDSSTKSAPSSVDIPSTDDSETPASKSILTVKDMLTLLDVNDALDELHEALILIAGDVGIGSDGLIRKLDKVSSVIVNVAHPRTTDQNDLTDNPNEWIYEQLEDKTIDNERKARMLLGMEK